MPMREALAESRNAVAIWLTGQIGIDAVLRTSRALGVRHAAAALSDHGARARRRSRCWSWRRPTGRSPRAWWPSPTSCARSLRSSGDADLDRAAARRSRSASMPAPLALIQEGLRGVVRMPTGTAHALTSRAFPIAVMGKTGHDQRLQGRAVRRLDLRRRRHHGGGAHRFRRRSLARRAGKPAAGWPCRCSARSCCGSTAIGSLVGPAPKFPSRDRTADHQVPDRAAVHAGRRRPRAGRADGPDPAAAIAARRARGSYKTKGRRACALPALMSSR